jgi:hypothetical protein
VGRYQAPKSFDGVVMVVLAICDVEKWSMVIALSV